MATVRRLTFAEMLRQRRRNADLTQAALAERAGLSLRCVSDIERDLKRPQAYTLGRLADALGLSGTEREAFEASARDRHAPLVRGLTPPTPGPARADSASGWLPPLVGREREFALLTRHLSTETPPLLALMGEPGIGKSRLLAEAGALALAAGWQVLKGGCTRRSGQQPYAPFVDLLARAILNGSLAKQRRDLAGCSWLVRLVPELAETRAVPSPQWTLPPEQERRLVFAAVARYVANVAGPAGVLLVLDDLQWAGSDAIDLLESLTRITGVPTSGSFEDGVVGAADTICARQPIRLLLAYRDTEVRPEHPLAMLIADLAREGLAATHPLDPLEVSEASELAQRLLDGGRPRADADGRTDGALAQEIAQRTGGRPFFVVSYAQALLAAHDANPVTTQAETARDVPWNVAASIRQRIAMLPEAAQGLLGVAAVAGRHTSRDILMLVSAQLGIAHPELLAALEAADQARLLLAVGSEGYEFAHDLVREVVAADLSPARRAALHGWVGDALERAPEHKRQAAELAWHFQQAGQLARALPYALQAGDAAESVYAHTEAEKHYRIAVELAREAGGPAREAEALEKLGKVLVLLARYEEARATGERAIQRYQQVGDRKGELRSLALFLDNLPSEALERILPLLASLEEEGESVYSRDLVAIYSSLANHYDSNDRLREAKAAATRAVEIARAIHDDTALVQALNRQIGAATALGEDTLPHWLTLIPQAERAGDLYVLSEASEAIASIYRDDYGDFALAAQHLTRGLDAAQQRGGVAPILWRHGSLMLLDYYRGEWDRAQERGRQASALLREGLAGDMPWGWYQVLLALGTLDLAQGRQADAEGRLGQALAFGFTLVTSPESKRSTQRLLAERDLLAEAPAIARDRLQSLLDRPGMQERDVPALLPFLAWAQLALERDAEAAATLAQCRARCGKLSLVDTLRVEALLAIKQQRWDDAAASLDESLAMCRAMPYPYAEAKALYVYGQLHAAKGEVRLAREKYQAALSICERLGEGLYRPHVEQALAGLRSGE